MNASYLAIHSPNTVLTQWYHMQNLYTP